MAEYKTKPSDVSPVELIKELSTGQRQQDALTLLDLFTEVTGQKAVVWGPSMIGFGVYHQRTKAGTEGDWMAAGFAPRKANLVLYGLKDSPEGRAMLPQLGSYRESVACVYVTRLEKIDLAVLRELIRINYDFTMKELHRP